VQNGWEIHKKPLHTVTKSSSNSGLVQEKTAKGRAEQHQKTKKLNTQTLPKLNKQSNLH
jgi:hypothetical protein